MNLWRSFVQYSKELLAKLFIRLVVGVLGGRAGDHLRKVYFIQSLHRHIAETLQVPTACVGEICKITEVVVGEEILRVPTRLYTLLWEGEPVESVILSAAQCNDFDKAVDDLVETAPWWLLYGRDGDMREDARKLFAAMGIGTQCQLAV